MERAAGKEPFKIFSVEVFNLNSTAMFCGEPVPKGCLGVTVDRNPDFLYQQLDNCFVANDCGIVQHYQHVPHSRDGFAGRPITLPLINQGIVFLKRGVTRRTFKGSLWDSVHGKSAAASVYGPLFKIGVKTPWDRVYFACNATQEFMDRIAKVIVLGSPEQSPLL